jgi:hypothetical protein
MSITTTETPAETIARLEHDSATVLTWDQIRAIAEHEIRHEDQARYEDEPEDLEAWVAWTEHNRAWFERHR